MNMNANGMKLFFFYLNWKGSRPITRYSPTTSAEQPDLWLYYISNQVCRTHYHASCSLQSLFSTLVSSWQQKVGTADTLNDLRYDDAEVEFTRLHIRVNELVEGVKKKSKKKSWVFPRRSFAADVFSPRPITPRVPSKFKRLRQILAFRPALCVSIN